MSLWDSFKAAGRGRRSPRKPLIDWFAELPRGETRLGAAGKLMSAADLRRLLDAGADFAVLGRAAILHHDFPKQYAAEPGLPADRRCRSAAPTSPPRAWARRSSNT